MNWKEKYLEYTVVAVHAQGWIINLQSPVDGSIEIVKCKHPEHIELGIPLREALLVSAMRLHGFPVASYP